MPPTVRPAERLSGIEISIIRQINALARPGSINLGIGEPNLEPDDAFREKARAAATASWKYTPNAGTMRLRELIAAAGRFDPASEVCITAGTEEALFSIFQAYAGPGDEVLVPDPGFSAYATLAKLAGAAPVAYPLEPPSWELDAREVAARITPRTKLIIINTPSNPLGAAADAAALEAIAREAGERGCLVVSDEVYREIHYGERPASMLGSGDNVIVVSGMSKSHGMTGLRLGWAIARASVMKPIVTAHQYAATCASAFSQALAESVLSDAAWNAGWLDRVRMKFQAQRDAALEAIRGELEADLEPPSGAFYAFAPVPSCGTLGFAKSIAEEANVLVIPGVAFGERGEGFIRISYAAEPSEIREGLGRIGEWLRKRGR